jgi:hypothetical protein
VAGIGYRYIAKKHWTAGITGNYFDEIYLEPNPDRRTAEAVSKYTENEKELAAMVTTQQRLPSYYTIGLSASKSLRVAKKYFVNINLTVNNLTGNTNILVSGYEQLRWDKSTPDKFAPKYVYMTGLTWMLTLSVNF